MKSSTSDYVALTVAMSAYCAGAVTEGNGHELIKVLVRVECLRKTLNSSSTKILQYQANAKFVFHTTEWATKKQPAFRIARVLVIFSLALVCMLHSKIEKAL